MSNRLTRTQLNELFLEDLGERVKWNSPITDKTLLVDLENPNRRLRVYIYNCTCPPGGRALDEFKIQLIVEGQKRGERGHLDDSDGRIPLVVGYAQPLDNHKNGIYIIWDSNHHMEFAFSANLQCYLEPMLDALTEDVVVCKKRGNKEKIVVATRTNIGAAIETRISLEIEELLL